MKTESEVFVRTAVATPNTTWIKRSSLY